MGPAADQFLDEDQLKYLIGLLRDKINEAEREKNQDLSEIDEDFHGFSDIKPHIYVPETVPETIPETVSELVQETVSAKEFWKAFQPSFVSASVSETVSETVSGIVIFSISSIVKFMTKTAESLWGTDKLRVFEMEAPFALNKFVNAVKSVAHQL